MQEKVSLLAYSEKEEICPKCGGKGKISSLKSISWKYCKSCNGSGTLKPKVSEHVSEANLEKKVFWGVAKQFQKCKRFKKCLHNDRIFLSCQKCGGFPDEIEQNIQVGETYEFILNTGKCEDCIEYCPEESDNCRLKSGSARSCKEKLNYPATGFEPKSFKGTVLEKIPFEVKYKELNSFINEASKESGFFIIDCCENLPDGSYVLVEGERI